MTSSDAVNPLAAKLNVKIEDCGAPGGAAGSCTPVSTKYDSTISTMGDIALGSFTTSGAGSAHRYRFSVTFPDGTPAVDNNYQGDSASVEYQWEAVQ